MCEWNGYITEGEVDALSELPDHIQRLEAELVRLREIEKEWQKIAATITNSNRPLDAVTPDILHDFVFDWFHETEAELAKTREALEEICDGVTHGPVPWYVNIAFNALKETD